MATIVGRNVRTARDARALTQRELAIEIGVDQMLLSKWERGLHSPSDVNLQALSAALDHPVAWFFTERPEVAA